MQTMMKTMQSINIKNGGGSSNHDGNNQQHGRWNNNNNGNLGYQGSANRNQNHGNNNGNNNNGNNNNNQNGDNNRKTMRQNTAGRMGFVLTWGKPAELLLMATKPPPLEPIAWAAVGAASDPLDRYRKRIN